MDTLLNKLQKRVEDAKRDWVASIEACRQEMANPAFAAVYSAQYADRSEAPIQPATPAQVRELHALRAYATAEKQLRAGRKLAQI